MTNPRLERARDNYHHFWNCFYGAERAFRTMEKILIEARDSGEDWLVAYLTDWLTEMSEETNQKFKKRS